MFIEKLIKILILIHVILIGNILADPSVLEFEETARYVIEGKVHPPEIQFSDENWQTNTRVTINDGEYLGFIRNDGQFIISNVPSGSYVVEIFHPDYYYESVRVEINPKGKFRARKLNYIQPAQILQVPYPLKLKALTRFNYFQMREQWKITDFLFSPMVLMMILPLILMLVLPKLMSDPETKKEMENLNINKMTSEMPEISEMITSFFSGSSQQNANSNGSGVGGASKKDDHKPLKGTSKQNKKRN